MKKGFTLVELLAVIIVLGLIVLITIPIVRDTIDDQRFKQFKLSVEGLLKAANEDTAMEDYKYPRRYEYKSVNGIKDLYLIPETGDPIPLQVSGNIRYNPEAIIVMEAEDELTVYVINRKYCALKEEEDQDVIYGEYTEFEDENELPKYISEDDIDLTDKINRLKNS